METGWLLLGLILGGVAGLFLGYMLSRLVRGRGDQMIREEMREAFQALAHQSLRDNSDMFLDRTKAELAPLEKSLDKLEEHVRELEQKREGAYQGLAEQLRQVAQTQSALQETTITLSQAMRSSRARGHWGELQLRRIVELSGLVEHVDFEEQETAGDGRPDMTVYLPNGAVLPVDAKAPMSSYLEAVGASEPETCARHLAAHARAMRERVRELARRQYWAQFEHTPQFVIMFVPNESCLHAAFDHDGELFEYALQSQVVITSPVTLLALLKAVAYGWQQVRITENARTIADEGRELYGRIGRLMEHINDLGTHLGRALDAFNSLVGSFEHRLLPGARRFRDLGISMDDLPPLAATDGAPRRLRSEELQD